MRKQYFDLFMKVLLGIKSPKNYATWTYKTAEKSATIAEWELCVAVSQWANEEALRTNEEALQSHLIKFAEDLSIEYNLDLAKGITLHITNDPDNQIEEEKGTLTEAAIGEKRYNIKHQTNVIPKLKEEAQKRGLEIIISDNYATVPLEGNEELHWYHLPKDFFLFPHRKLRVAYVAEHNIRDVDWIQKILSDVPNFRSDNVYLVFKDLPIPGKNCGIIQANIVKNNYICFMDNVSLQ